MSKYDVVVIGAGCGGMTAAVTAAQNGFKTLLLEKHNIPGGCATSFIRGRFEFEVSLHQLSGMGTEEKPGPLRKVFQKLGVLDQLDIVQDETLYGVRIKDELNINLPANRKELVKSLIHQFPDDSEEIDEFFNFLYDFVYQFAICTTGADTSANPSKYPLFFKYALKDMKSVLGEFFQNPHLQICVGSYGCYFGLPIEKLPFQLLAGCLWTYIENKPSHFEGGSQAMSNALMDCFSAAGGHVKFNCGAKKIITENGYVKGVLTDDDEFIETGNVISNANPIDTYTKMINQEDVPQSTIKKLNSKELAVSGFTVYLGLDCSKEDLNITPASSFLYDKQADLNGIYGNPFSDPHACMLTCYNNVSPTFSPKGTCQMVLLNLQYGEPWQSIAADDYSRLKYRYADQMIKLAEEFYPGIRKHIEEVEIATPITHMRYLTTPGGSIYGFSLHKKDLLMFSENETVINGLFFAGGWVAGGGYQPTLQSGVKATLAMMKQYESGEHKHG